MSKHLPENQKWSIFLNTATNSNSIHVQSVTSQEISFTTTDLSVLNSLNDPKIMKGSTIHAIRSSTEDSIQSSIENEHTEQLIPFPELK